MYAQQCASALSFVGLIVAALVLVIKNAKKQKTVMVNSKHERPTETLAFCSCKILNKSSRCSLIFSQNRVYRTEYHFFVECIIFLRFL